MNAERYSRQIAIPEFGELGQEKLENSSVLIIGAGGLGSNLMYALAGAGVGTIGIADHEIVKTNNLNTQFIHYEEDLGTLKVLSAAKKLRQFNSFVNIIPHSVAINKDNALELISQYDIVVLAVNAMQARMIVNEACVALDKPFVNGEVNGSMGTATFIVPGKTPCLGCLYGTDILPEESFGAISTTTGIIAYLEATAVIQYLLGKEVPMEGKLFYYNSNTMEIEKTPLSFNKDCPVCSK